MADTPDLDAIRQRHERFEPAAHDRAVLLAEVERLRAERDRLVEGIAGHMSEKHGVRSGEPDEHDERLWALLDTSDDQEDR